MRYFAFSWRNTPINNLEGSQDVVNPAESREEVLFNCPQIEQNPHEAGFV